MKKIKCEKCSQTHGGFHLCPANLVGPEPVQPKQTRSVAWSSAVRTAQAERWAQYHEDNAARDAEIVAKYQDGMSFQELGEEFGVNPSTARLVVVRAGVERRPASKRKVSA